MDGPWHFFDLMVKRVGSRDRSSTVGDPQRATLAGSPAVVGLQDWPAAYLASPGVITSLHLTGRRSPPLSLSTALTSFSIGTEGCDLLLSRLVTPYVSAYHARLERTPGGLRVIDQGSKNGLFSSPTTGRVSALEVGAGGRFWLADVEVLALDAELEALRPALAACIGLDDEVRIDRALAWVGAGGPLALIGPPGTGAARLARQIHDTSARRASFFLELNRGPLPALDHGCGTVFVDLETVPLMAPAASILFASPPRVRAIVSATTERRVRTRLAQHRDQVSVIELVPLARRPHDVVPLLAAHWVNVLRSRRRVAELGAGVRHLAAHSWPGNLDELHQQSPRLLALLEHPTLRAAAQALGIRRQTLSGHLARLGLTITRQEGER